MREQSAIATHITAKVILARRSGISRKANRKNKLASRLAKALNANK